jgi:beta-lactamase regulating signal transducer with metallopeptidase domain
MNTLLQWAASPVGGILWKWTALLALAWLAHSWLRPGDARWRLILWRSVLVFSLVLPLTTLWSLPALTINFREPATMMPMQADVASSPAGERAIPVHTSSATSPGTEALRNPKAMHLKGTSVKVAANPIPWNAALLAVWLLGGTWGTTRLIWFRTRLARLRGTACPAKAELTELAGQIRTQLGVRRNFKLRISDEIQSPFVCGLWQPVVMLPLRLVETLSTSEMAGLLRHEVAHLRGHDLWWSAGWRWLQVFGWFQPLVWRIPAAHSLACEEEADRMASGRAEERAGYAQLLAQLALRVLALPAVETKLTLNGSAQIVRRLQQLQRRGDTVWKRRHTVAGMGLTALLFLVAVSCGVSRKDAGSRSNGGFKRVMVVVQDKDGQPIAGATVKPFGFRVQGPRRVDGYGWNTNQFGPADPVTTDAEGKAWLKYPVVAIPGEKLLTGALTFSVSHPDYCPVVEQDYPVNGTGKPFRLIKGISLEVSGYYGPNRQPVTELVPNLSQEGIKPADWQKEGNGVYAYHQLSAGGHLIQLMGRLPSGEIVYSDTLAFTAEKGKPCHFEMEMKPGIRIEGRLDDKVPRPVKNGRVLIDVRPPQFPAYLIPEDVDALWKKYGYVSFWRTYRPIAEDGTFVFESVPPGEVDVIVHGDGFVSKSIGKLQNRVDGRLVAGPDFAIPQSFPLTAPVTRIEVATEPTATLELTAKTKSGKPIEGATVYLNPNVMRMGGIFGWMKQSSEEPFRTLKPLPPLPYSGETDSNGRVEIRNLPAEEHGLDIRDPQFEVALHDKRGLPNRRVPATFAPGMTNIMTVTLERAGNDFIGTAR